MKRVRAIIITNGKLLTIKRVKPDITYWVIPGGAVEAGETNERALIREVKEELGLDIEPQKIILTVDSKKPEIIGQKEFFYLCNITGGVIGTGNGPEYAKDTKYIGRYNMEWLDINNLDHYDLKPKEIRDFIYKKYN